MTVHPPSSAGNADARQQRPTSAYAIAVVAALIAIACRVLLDPVLGTRHRFATLYGAALLVASRYGFGPGFAVVVSGALTMAALSQWQITSLRIDGLFSIDLAMHVAIAGAIAWVAASMRDATVRAGRSASDVDAQTEALRRSEERYRSFIHQSSEGIWRCELDRPMPISLPEDEQIAWIFRYGYLPECNDAMARMYGYGSASEMTDVRLNDLLVPTDPANREYLLAFIRSGYRLTDAESHELDRDGNSKYFLNNFIGVVEEGHCIRAWGTQRDVTERRRAEEALRTSEERLRFALEAGRMSIWDWNMETGTVEWTNTFQPGPPAHKSDTNDGFFARVHPDDRPNVRACVRAAIDGDGAYECEFRLVRHDGTVRWMLGKGETFRNAEGRAVRMVGVGADITERKQVEQRVQELLVREREARAEAESSNKAKDEFLATLSHELRSPLSAALSWTHMLRRGFLDEEKSKRALETIERNTRLQVRLIEDLLDISRIVSGKLTLEVGLVDVSTVIDAAVEAAQTSADARQVRLETRHAPEVLLLNGDAARLQQIVGNLLANAIKFTPPGGSVAVEARRVAQRAEIAVRDTGIGMAADLLPHVFDRFRQADSSTTRRYGGLGLGLAIVRHLVELHGGTIEAESPGENQGTVMRVRLPLEPALDAPPSDATQATATAPDLPRLDGVHVLVVDDEPDIRDFLATTIAVSGARVTVAASVSEAMAQMSVAPADVVLTDLAMPDRDGYALLREVRAACGAVVPVLAVTALASAPERQRALAAGFDQHLTKPVDPTALITAIARVLRRAGRAATDRRTA